MTRRGDDRHTYYEITGVTTCSAVFMEATAGPTYTCVFHVKRCEYCATEHSTTEHSTNCNNCGAPKRT